jgi:hypothetical protein
MREPEVPARPLPGSGEPGAQPLEPAPVEKPIEE